jgi:hypothetical protein
MSLFWVRLDPPASRTTRRPPLREIDAPSGPDVDAKFGDTVAYRFHVAEKSSFKPFDPSDHNATNRRVCQLVEPRGELREWLDAEHQCIGIDRLHPIKPICSDCGQQQIRFKVGAHGRCCLAPNRLVESTRFFNRACLSRGRAHFVARS